VVLVTVNNNYKYSSGYQHVLVKEKTVNKYSSLDVNEPWLAENSK
jgi:hypothetical protein